MSSDIYTNHRALHLLRCLVRDGNRPGQGLRLEWLLFGNFGFRDPLDLANAAEHAQQKGWVLISEQGFVALTEEGYALGQ